MLRKLNNESVTILSAVASGLVVNALYPSVSRLFLLYGDLIRVSFGIDKVIINSFCAFIDVVLVFVLFFLTWKFCTYYIPVYIRYYEIRKKIRYVPKSVSEEITSFYKVFVETMKWKNNTFNYSDDFFIILNKTIDLGNRLILSTTRRKDPITLNNIALRTFTKNQHYLNYRKYINTYELIATIDVLLDILEKLNEAYTKLNLKDKLMKYDIEEGIKNLKCLKNQIPLEDQ